MPQPTKKTATQDTSWFAYKPAAMDRLVVFFGGFFDATFEPVKSVVDVFVSQKRYGEGTGLLYFSWSDAAWWSDFARKKIVETAAGANLKGLALVGHSYGGHSARKVAGSMNLAVDALVTVDAVSWESALFWCSKPAGVKRWFNVYTSGFSDFSDAVAAVGGHWGSESGADYNRNVPSASHAEFGRMFVVVEPLMKKYIGLGTAGK